MKIHTFLKIKMKYECLYGLFILKFEVNKGLVFYHISGYMNLYTHEYDYSQNTHNYVHFYTHNIHYMKL